MSVAALSHITYTRRLLLTICGILVLHLLIFDNTCNALTSYFLAVFNSQNEQITRVLTALAACSAAVQSVIFSTFYCLSILSLRYIDISCYFVWIKIS